MVVVMVVLKEEASFCEDVDLLWKYLAPIPPLLTGKLTRTLTWRVSVFLAEDPVGPSKAVAGSTKSTPSQERCARRNPWVLLRRSFCHGSLAYVAAVLLEVCQGLECRRYWWLVSRVWVDKVEKAVLTSNALGSSRSN